MRRGLQNLHFALPAHNASGMGGFIASPSPGFRAFCERCGGRLGTHGRANTPIPCFQCGCFVCSTCEAAPNLCRSCAGERVVPVAPERVRADRIRVAVAGVGLAVLGLFALIAIAAPRSYAPETGVAGATGTPPASERSAGAAASTTDVGVGAPPASPGAHAPAGTPSASEPASAVEGSFPAPAPPTPAGSMALTSMTVRAWPTAVGGTSLHVIVAVRNGGSETVALDPAASTYTIRERAGATVAVGRFAAALPRTLVPGATAYLVATDTTPFAESTAGLAVEPHVSVAPGTRELTDLRVTASPPRASGGSVTVPVTITNESAASAANVMIGAVLLDARDRALAALYGLADIGPLAPGTSAKVTLDYPPAGPLDPENVARVVASAFELGS